MTAAAPTSSSESLQISGFDGYLAYKFCQPFVVGYSDYEQRFILEHPDCQGYAMSGGMTDNLAREYYEQLIGCSECQGIEGCRWHGLLTVPVIDHDSRTVHWRARRCEPSASANAKRVLEIRQKAAGIPRRYWSITATDFDATGNAIALTAVRAFAANRQSVMLYGGRGCGKTMLAAIMSNAALKNGEEVVFFSVAEMNTTLRAAINDGSLETQLRRMIKAAVLVLDDIGAEAATTWSMEQLFVIINGRYNDGDGRLIITSNVTPLELRQQWKRINDVGERIFSRLSEMCIFAEVNGSDRRLQPRQ